MAVNLSQASAIGGNTRSCTPSGGGKANDSDVGRSKWHSLPSNKDIMNPFTKIYLKKRAAFGASTGNPFDNGFFKNTSSQVGGTPYRGREVGQVIDSGRATIGGMTGTQAAGGAFYPDMDPTGTMSGPRGSVALNRSNTIAQNAHVNSVLGSDISIINPAAKPGHELTRMNSQPGMRDASGLPTTNISNAVGVNGDLSKSPTTAPSPAVAPQQPTVVSVPSPSAPASPVAAAAPVKASIPAPPPIQANQPAAPAPTSVAAAAVPPPVQANRPPFPPADKFAPNMPVGLRQPAPAPVAAAPTAPPPTLAGNKVNATAAAPSAPMRAPAGSSQASDPYWQHMFRHLQGGQYNPNSSMDRQKMQAIMQARSGGEHAMRAAAGWTA